ncbi:unnamed protein product [Brassica rapa]|uniref:Uncharacterized protein n=1 Tax=Brassica campestris TaxID=3711 RepID=A0A8D9HB44_BRACM|nr:unnamed protein product [Brassica rapa]
MTDIKTARTIVGAIGLASILGASDRNCWLWPSTTQRAYLAAKNYRFNLV